MCPLARRSSLKLQQKFYILTKPPNPPKQFPNQSTNLAECVSYPLLNQSTSKVVARSLTNPELYESKWLLNYVSMTVRNRILSAVIRSKNPQYKTNDDYSNLLKTFRSSQTKGVVPLRLPGLKVNHASKNAKVHCILHIHVQ